MAGEWKRPGPRETWVLVAILSFFVTTGCRDQTAPPNPDFMAREAFIAVYVDLRVAALRSPGQEVSAEAREGVLRDHGITADDLLAFADYYGSDIAYMRDVWNDVEVRLDSIRSTSTSPILGDTAR